MSQTAYRYDWPKKAIKSDCPDCGPKHRKTLSRYVDTRTGEPLPEQYGRCDRLSNCGYHLSPYHKEASGLSYADVVYQQWKEEQELARPRSIKPQPATLGSREQDSVTNLTRQKPAKPIEVEPEKTVWSIPDELFRQSLGHYERNQFAYLLRQHLGIGVANDLLDRFQIGTSSRWPGATVFWYIDEQDRKRGGQIKLFGEDFHTAKYVDSEGRKRSRTDWVHSAYARRFEQQQQLYPAWLTAYLEQREFSPCLFGLQQLKAASIDQPIAIVEAPKTAILCSAYFPGFVWMAVGALSYLNRERLTPLQDRTIMLFPDLSRDGSAFNRWSQKADQLRSEGFLISVSSLLEDNASDGQREEGADLADYLVDQWKGYPPDWDTLDDNVAIAPTATRSDANRSDGS